MGFLKSGHIKVVEKNGDWYKYEFSLYDENNNFPHMYNNISSSFKNILFQYFIFGIDGEEIIFENFKASLYIISSIDIFNASTFILLLSKNNDKILIDKINDKKYSFEIIIEKDNPKTCALIIYDDKLRRAEKIKKIKEKICL